MQGLVIHYRACSERDAWRKPPKHKTLRNALFEEFGVRELFREGSKLNRERTKNYGRPLFAVVWIENEPWALLIKERVATIIPFTVVQHYEGSPTTPPKKRKSADYVAKVKAQLSKEFDTGTVHLLLDEQEFSGTTVYDPNVIVDGDVESPHVEPADLIDQLSESNQSTVLGDSESTDELEDYYLQLYEAVKSSLANKESRRARLRDAQTSPEIFHVQAKVYRRNPDVIAEVLDRANGICEVCGSDAPFRRSKDDHPYLEVHHQVPLSTGGEDSVENAVALCPNCHRRHHYG